MKHLINLLIALFTVSNLWGQNFVFENLGIPISKKDSVQIVKMIHYQMDFYNKISPIDSAHIKLKVFDNLTQYVVMRDSNRLEKEGIYGVGTMSGVFQPRDSTAYVYRVPSREERQLPLIYHEIAHYFFHITIPAKHNPTWLDEGLSRYFENSKITRRKGIVHNLNSYTKGRIKTMIESNDLDLKNIMELDHRSFMKKQRISEGLAYTIAHGMVYFLAERNFEQFKAMMLEIKNGKPSFDALDTTYSGGFAQFETDFMTYFRK